MALLLAEGVAGGVDLHADTGVGSQRRGEREAGQGEEEGALWLRMANRGWVVQIGRGDPLNDLLAAPRAVGHPRRGAPIS